MATVLTREEGRGERVLLWPHRAWGPHRRRSTGAQRLSREGPGCEARQRLAAHFVPK